MGELDWNTTGCKLGEVTNSPSMDTSVVGQVTLKVDSTLLLWH